MVSLQSAIDYPRTRENWLRTILIGGVLSLLTVFLVPLLIVYGFVVRTIRERIDGAEAPPQFDEWGELLVEGVQAWVIGIIYMLVPLIVGSVMVGGAVIGALSGGDPMASVAGLLGGFAITTVLSLVFGYFAVAAIVNFATEQEFGAAFDVDTIKRLGLSRSYAVPWLLSVVVFFAASILTGILNIIPGLGLLIGPFVTFYAALVAADLWASGYTDTMAAPEGADRTDIDESLA